MKILTIFLLCFVLSNIAYSQTTTIDDFNYLTDTYRLEEENGVTHKPEYKFVDAGMYNIANGTTRRLIILKLVYRVKKENKQLVVSTTPCAMLCIYKKTDTTKPTENFMEYLCIPRSDAGDSLWNRCYEQFTPYTEISSLVMMRALALGIGHTMGDE